MSLEVNTKKISDCLALLKKGQWQIPKFQRDFVWKSSQVKELIQSILKGYPLGLVTVWDQPQSAPHTQSEPIVLKDKTSYQDFDESPAVVKMVLDGKQRLTSLAMVFGGLKSKDKRYSFTGDWYIDLNKFMSEGQGRDTCVVFYKDAELEKHNLDSVSSRVANRLLPLNEYESYDIYLSAVHNPSTYSTVSTPSQEEKDNLVRAISEIKRAIDNIKIPVAEISSAITLGEVCEIFDVLNTTGTKVSTFDLLHNNLYSKSEGVFVLKDVFKTAADLTNLGLLCDENRQEFFCQMVTGAFLLSEERKDDKYKSIATIKGKDLIETPLEYYVEIQSEFLKLDVYSKDLLDDVLGFVAPIKEIPYPASTILYLSLRVNGTEEYKSSSVTKLFKAFYWRNVLLTRYDQGFLSQFGRDLFILKGILTEVGEDKYDEKLDEMLGAGSSYLSEDSIKALLLDSDLGGALKQAMQIVIKSNVKNDIVSQSPLAWDAHKGKGKVELHHIFPAKWCKSNDGVSESITTALNDYGRNCIANMMPLSSQSNRSWSDVSPATAIQTLNLDWHSSPDAYIDSFIHEEQFGYLQSTDIKSFLESRASIIAKHVYEMQFVSH
ncbi:DUF262 domain-containing protein [Cobetia amphilecti]|uniref:DUF262 domain-containing protein n=1 Tax=Cobetia amphilecti TaxID=1055104 RepID=A0AAP4U0A4_9GAMM|nr:DUF262 domain-containing protein [Cobetia amphilecti]MDO6672251.1 DUF262 domain-containing protein [Cobetia amphilecti]